VRKNNIVINSIIYAVEKDKLLTRRIKSDILLRRRLQNPADMFESVNKKTVVHPFCKVGFFIANRLPEELRLNSDG